MALNLYNPNTGKLLKKGETVSIGNTGRTVTQGTEFQGSSAPSSNPGTANGGGGGIYLSSVSKDASGKVTSSTPSTFYAYSSKYFQPTPITSTSLEPQGSINVGAPNFVNAAGALASTAPSLVAVPEYGSVNPDGSVNKFDPNTGQSLKADQSQKFFQDYLDSLEAPPSTAELYDKAQRDAGLQQKQQEVANYTAQLNTIQAQAKADQLAVVGQGRGIPEAIIGGQQAQIAKEAAIKALPVAAQLAAAQNNLQLAQQHVDTMFKLLSQDAQNQYQFRAETRQMVYNFLTTQEKARLADIQAKDKQSYNEYQDLLDMKNKLLQSAYAQGAPLSIKNAIQNATTTQQAIAAAGQYNGTLKTGGSAPTLSILDVQRYNEAYPDAGVQPGDTAEQANAKVQASLTGPETSLMSVIQDERNNGRTYAEVIQLINDNSAISDKQAARDMASMVYGDTFVSTPSVANMIGNFFNGLTQ